MDKKNVPANKIVSSNRLSLKPSMTMFKAILDGVSDKEADAARRRLIKKSQKARMKIGHMRHWVPNYSTGKPKEPRLQKMSKSARNAQKLKVKSDVKRMMNSPEWKKFVKQKGWKPISLEQQHKQFQSLDDSIKFQKGEYKGKHFSDSQKMAKAYYDNLYKFHKTNETRNLQLQIKERNRLLYEINKKLKAGVNAPDIPKKSSLKVSNLSKLSKLGSNVGQLGAGVVLNALYEKYLDPLAVKAGKKIGKSLIPVGKNIDQLLTNKNVSKKRK